MVVIMVLLLLGLFILFLSYFIASELALALLGFAAAIITAGFQYRAAKNKETEARLFSEKQGVYTELTDILMDVLYAQKDSAAPIDNDELTKQIQTIRKKFMIWGSFDTIRSFDQLGEIGVDSHKTTDPTILLLWFGRLFHNMRKDLGHKDPRDSHKEIALGILVANERAGFREAIKKSTA